jgi:hypothetical protein
MTARMKAKKQKHGGQKDDPSRMHVSNPATPRYRSRRPHRCFSFN